MTTVRLATTDDLGTLVALGLLAAARRQAAEPALWPLAPDARQRLEAALARDLAQPEGFAWLLAEEGGQVHGAAQLRLLPAPPVYDLGGGLAGQLGEDSLLAGEAPAGTFGALLEAAETFMRQAGAVVLTAAVPQAWNRQREALAAAGYGPLSDWLLNPEVSGRLFPPGVRPAREADLPGLVALNAGAQRLKCAAEPRFWTPHPQAPQRFEAWMRASLGLTDRDLLVDEGGGFVVAQPGALPAAHDAGRLGQIDDFCVSGWQDSLTATDASGAPDALLSAAEAACARRGRTGVLAVCPAAWTARRDFLLGRGYRPALCWLLKRPAGG